VIRNTPDHAAVNILAGGYRISQALYAATALGVPDRLMDGPRSTELLAADTSSHAPSLARLLRVLAGFGLVEEDQGSWALTPRGRLLSTKTTDSLNARVSGIGEPLNWATWGLLLECVRTGEPAFHLLHGTDPFTYFEANAHTDDVLMERLTAEGAARGEAIAQAYDFDGVGLLVDVGGAWGAVLAAILQHYPKMRGLLADLAHVTPGSASVLRKTGVDHRVNVQEVDFLQAVPEGGDLYMISAVLHSLGDEDCVTLLRNCRAVLGDTARLLVIDEVLPADVRTQTAHLLKDLQLMVNTRGRQRRLDEYHQLAAAANMEITLVIETELGDSIMEVRVASAHGDSVRSNGRADRVGSTAD
jgi:hypothetical protein